MEASSLNLQLLSCATRDRARHSSVASNLKQQQQQQQQHRYSVLLVDECWARGSSEQELLLLVVAAVEAYLNARCLCVSFNNVSDDSIKLWCIVVSRNRLYSSSPTPSSPPESATTAGLSPGFLFANELLLLYDVGTEFNLNFVFLFTNKPLHDAGYNFAC